MIWSAMCAGLVLFMGIYFPTISSKEKDMNTNTNNSSNANTVEVQAIETPATTLGTIKEMIDLIDKLSGSLSIKEAEDVMDDLEQLQYSVSESVSMRIPCDRLSLVEGYWYLTVTTDTDDAAARLEKYRSVLMTSSLESLKGYAVQSLVETHKEILHLFGLMADPLDTYHAAALSISLDKATSERDALENTVEILKANIVIHGPTATAMEAALRPSVIDALVPDVSSEEKSIA